MKPCDICSGRGTIALPVQRELTVEEMVGDGPGATAPEDARTFPCPQCTKLVPFQRVRALRAVSTVDYANFGKFQNPIERELARQFGTYLHREGLIRFGASNLDDPRAVTVDVRAELNVVLPKDATGATALVVETEAPSIPSRLTREERERLGRNGGIVTGYSAPTRRERARAYNDEAVPWTPKVFTPEPPPKTRREKIQAAAAARAGIEDRFSGIDFTTSGDDFDD